jgi:hypothetical protein
LLNHNSIAWEEPTLYVSLHNVSSEHFISLVKRNLEAIYYFDFRKQAGMIFLIILLASLFIGGAWKNDKKHLFIFLTCYLALYLLYVVILVHTRYIWLNIYLLFLIAAVLAQRMKALGVVLFILLTLLVFKKAFKEIVLKEDRQISAATMLDVFVHPASYLDESYSEENKVYNTVQATKNLFTPNSNIALLNNSKARENIYPYTALFALYDDLKLEGFTDNISSLKKFDVKYYFIWNDAVPPDQTKIIYEDKDLDLKIYSID